VQREGIHLRGRPAIKTVMAGIIRDHVFHPVRDYLDGLRWDGEPRLDKMLITYFGVEEVPNYTTLVGSKWMISAVARIFQPGCIAKYCLLLLGPQDIGKSTALSILGGEFYTDDISDLGTKDSAMQNAGVWIVELAELASTRKAHIDSVKSFISRTVDRFRPPYGTHVIERPRQSVLAGTVNPSDSFLKDETGNVRYWPNTCTSIDLDALRRDRDQLWAEAVSYYRTGENWWLETEDVIQAAREEQAAHAETVEDHPWFSIIEHWLRDEERLAYASPELHEQRLRQTDNSFVFTISEVLARLGIKEEHQSDQRIIGLVGKILRRLGLKSGAVRLADAIKGRTVVRRWQRVDETCDRRSANGERCSAPIPCRHHPEPRL
jgi:predicted P-loop ATPase